MGISLKQFEQLKQRVANPRKPSAIHDVSVLAGASKHQVILGIDPSLRGTGYGIIKLARPVPRVLAHGTIRCPPAWERSRCLLQITSALRDLLKREQPDVCVVEGLFYAQNLQTA